MSGKLFWKMVLKMNLRSGLTEGVVLFGESDEEVNGVGIDAGPFIFLGMKDSVAYVSC
jgi:hypothetical protein